MKNADFTKLSLRNKIGVLRQLQRQYNSSLYERLALSKDKDSVLRLAQEGQTINKPDDIIKNPLTLFSNHCSIIYTKNYGQFVMF